MAEEVRGSPLAEARSWDLVSAGYEKYMRKFLEKFSEKGLQRLDISKDQRLLDVACGPGTTSLLAAPGVRSIEGVDFSAKMVGVFQSHVQERSLTNVRVQVGDGQALPFDGASFERAVSMFGLMFFPDRVAGMREIHRVLVPGGRALVASWAPAEMSPLMEAMFGAMKRANPEGPEPKQDLHTLENPRLFEEELREAGFVQVSIEPCVCEYQFESGAALWDELVEGGVPLVLLRESLSAHEWERASATCRRHLDEVLRGKSTLSSTAYFGVGVKVS